MQRTATQQRTDTTEAVRYIRNRVLGDLIAIHDKFGMATEQLMYSLSHDVGVGLLYDCIESLRLFLYRSGWYEPHRAYVYHRVAPGSFDSSPHSGRIARDRDLVGGRLEFEVYLRYPELWESLKQKGLLCISWGPCSGRSTQSMTARADGGYASGDIGFSRTCFSR